MTRKPKQIVPAARRAERSGKASAVPALPEERAFAEIVRLIQSSRERALAVVNTALIDLYWQVGEAICGRIASDAWGQRTVASLAAYIQQRHPGVRGFSPQNLWRMRQFFEVYRDQSALQPLLKALPWSSNLHILTKSN